MPEETTRGLGLLTVEEFAQATKRTAAAVRASIARGDLPAHKLGSCRYFIRKKDIDRMFEGDRDGEQPCAS